MNERFGNFELREELGHGGMGKVFLALQKTANDRAVVVKVMYPHLAEDEHFVARFRIERDAIVALDHPNIVRLIESGEVDGQMYLVLEFIEGVDLGKWLRANGKPPLEIALLILRDLFLGLEHAHQREIIHRDVKPANLMLTPHGAIKIMDFGLARSGSGSDGPTEPHMSH